MNPADQIQRLGEKLDSIRVLGVSPKFINFARRLAGIELEFSCQLQDEAAEARATEDFDLAGQLLFAANEQELSAAGHYIDGELFDSAFRHYDAVVKWDCHPILVKKAKYGRIRACVLIGKKEEQYKNKREVFERLMRFTGPMVDKVCCLMLGKDPRNRDLRDDVFQDTYLKAWEKFEQCDDQKFTGWLRAIAVTTAIRSLRKSSTHLRHDAMAAKAESTNLRNQPESVTLSDLLSILAKSGLSDRQREIIAMWLLYGLNRREMAERLGTTVASINQSVGRAKERLASDTEFEQALRDYCSRPPEDR